MILNKPVVLGIISMLAMVSACRPVIAIGWGEFVLVVLVIVLLLGPLIIRLYRFLSHLQEIERNNKDETEK
jgi:hypothetical protein